MPFHQVGPLRYLTFQTLDHDQLVHAVFTRHGGVSPSPWNSLNLGGTVGDEKEHVAENRRRAFKALGRHPKSLFDVWQVHGAEVVCAYEPRPPHASHRQADVILTNRPNVTLMMRFADCVPILLHDPVRRVIGIVHAGWLGTVRKAAQAAIAAMQTEYGCRPKDILAAIGPSIGPDHYTVGAEVISQIQAAFGQSASALLQGSDGAVKLDLWAANRLLLEDVGVTSIEEARLCTACHTEDWFSHRAEGGKTGRFGVLIGLKEK